MKRTMQRLLDRVGYYLTRSLANDLRAQRKSLLSRIAESEARLRERLDGAATKAHERTAKQQRALDELAREVSSLRAEMRLRAARPRATRGRAEGGPRIALSSSELPSPRSSTGQPGERPGKRLEPAPPKDSILSLSACSVCGEVEHTQVCEYNKLLLLDAGLDEEARVYNYAMCHGCGVVYARQRPSGPRYAYLLNRFEVTLGRVQDGGPRSGNIALSSGTLSDEEQRALRARVAKGVFVSEHQGLSRREFVPALLRDRMAAGVHVELLGSLLELKAPRVLELRPRLGSIGAALRRLYGADVYGMPLFDSQQFLIRETYGIHVDHKLDYDSFSIPYPGEFDLVIANHMFTHAVRPGEFLATVRQRLRRGGHLYLYNEPDELDFLENGKSMINSLNAFHLQAFDAPSITRALASSGFEPVFVTHQGGNVIALARAGTSGSEWPRMGRDERTRRVERYGRARDAAILRLPDPLRSLFVDEWDEIVERACATGLADFDASGRLRMVKPPAGSD